ncbi:hypothetical protein [Algoriphagus faecimaris]|nr:hypothetical protein [Algoriphagus faecimaris]
MSKLPLLAFVLAAFAAVAFTSPKASTGEYGLAGGVWYDVTDIDPDEDTYVCNQDETEDCLFDQPFGMGQPISTEQEKVFVVQNASNLRIAQ